VGLPTIGVCIAKNQLNNIIEWENIDFLEYVGWYNEKNIIKNIDKLLENMKDMEIRESKSKAGRKIVDGKSSLNLIDKIIL
jgi:spore coat polysaccharide biosynthesis predicted glycosyltransferase SpsG